MFVGNSQMYTETGRGINSIGSSAVQNESKSKSQSPVKRIYKCLKVMFICTVGILPSRRSAYAAGIRKEAGYEWWWYQVTWLLSLRSIHSQ
ncbi:hypothetical protein C1H46_045909 [Malus baccata]|uniref:Uncharacterized protein n=1 Tax=Malus baccata TaxID=106549 RepID=A0A540K2P1_MALBA|nr:hypothetical protein C1H46_045909 [Malus baccata]